MTEIEADKAFDLQSVKERTYYLLNSYYVPGTGLIAL